MEGRPSNLFTNSTAPEIREAGISNEEFKRLCPTLFEEVQKRINRNTHINDYGIEIYYSEVTCNYRCSSKKHSIFVNRTLDMVSHNEQQWRTLKSKLDIIYLSENDIISIINTF